MLSRLFIFVKKTSISRPLQLRHVVQTDLLAHIVLTVQMRRMYSFLLGGTSHQRATAVVFLSNFVELFALRRQICCSVDQIIKALSSDQNFINRLMQNDLKSRI
jgi:hypothetical protein